MENNNYITVPSILLVIFLMVLAIENPEANYYFVVCMVAVAVGALYIEIKKAKSERARKDSEAASMAAIAKIENEQKAALEAERLKKLKQDAVTRENRARSVEDRRKIAAAAKEEKLNRKVASITDEHMSTLLLKYSQTAIKDDYGNLNISKWIDEVNYFLDEVVSKSANVPEERRSDVFDAILKQVKANQKKQKSPLLAYSERMSAKDFELYCANALKQSGWSSRLTKDSGDQGVDVIAEHGQYKAVFQCKKYSSPVGNAAVQEIIAGRHYEQANIAAVVSNATYTLSARRLASSANIFLLHYTELPSFINKLSGANVDCGSVYTVNRINSKKKSLGSKKGPTM